MLREQILAVIRDAILGAQEKKGWSLAQLARDLNKNEDTVARWRDGKTGSIDVESLAKLFDYAELSMDVAFGLDAQFPAPEQDRLRAIELRVASIEKSIVSQGNTAPPGYQVPSVSGELAAVPLYGGVAAGLGFVNDPVTEGQNVPMVLVPAHLVQREGTVLALKVAGASMSPMLEDGDIVIAWYDHGLNALAKGSKAGALMAITTVDYEEYVKHVYWNSDTRRVLLRSANQAYDDVVIDYEKILYTGPVIYYVRSDSAQVISQALTPGFVAAGRRAEFTDKEIMQQLFDGTVKSARKLAKAKTEPDTEWRRRRG